MEPIVQAAISALALEQRDPLIAVLHFLRDLLMYGEPQEVRSGVLTGAAATQAQQIVKHILLQHGEALVKQVLAGMMITFPRDCFADGSGLLLGMFGLLPAETALWERGRSG